MTYNALRTIQNISVYAALICLMWPSNAAASNVEKAVAEILPQVIDWRRHIHQNPELSNREYKTAAFVARHLQSLGLEVHKGIAHTGVVGVLKGNQPGPTIGLRADMDALPIEEKNTLPFASKARTTYNGMDVGVMHACGHDAHVAILMGTASVLSAMRDQIKGRVVFVFQPAEEGAPSGEEGGAELMIKEGLISKFGIEAMYGLHISSMMEVGKIGYKSGAAMASSDSFKILVKGKGSHGSAPWDGVDPIVVGSQIVLGLQTIVSRQIELTKAPGVITVGTINSGVRTNIIPDELTLTGTIRALDHNIRRELHQRIRTTAENIAKASGATALVKINEGNPITYNEPSFVKRSLPSLMKAVGDGNLKEMEWITGAEDFAFYAQKVPSFLFFLGGMPKGSDPLLAPSHHTPQFFIDDTRLDIGVIAFTHLILDYAK